MTLHYDIVFTTDPPMSDLERRRWVGFLLDLAGAIERREEVRLPIPRLLEFSGRRGIVARSDLRMVSS